MTVATQTLMKRLFDGEGVFMIKNYLLITLFYIDFTWQANRSLWKCDLLPPLYVYTVKIRELL